MRKVKRIAFSAVTLLLALSLAVAGSTAYFFDVETSTNNVLQAGAIDLTIDNESFYNGLPWPATTWSLKDLEKGDLFFDFHDLKPGDWGEDTISVHVTSNKAWACMDMTLVANDENVANEPELSSGDTSDDTNDKFDGELGDELNFIFWWDDKDNVLERNEVDKIFAQGTAKEILNSTIPLADSKHGYLGGGGPLEPDRSYFIGKAWCFGDLVLAPVEQGDNSPTKNPGIECLGANASNMSQTDVVYADLVFKAIQARHNELFECIRCENEGAGWADKVYEVSQGTKKDGSPITDPARIIPTYALGAPDGLFFSLGKGGWIILEFSSPIIGSELMTLEISGNRTAAHEEKAIVAVSEDASSWVTLGTAKSTDNGDGSTYFDLSGTGFSEIRYVKLADDTDFSIHPNNHDGYDIDSVEATVCLDKQAD